MVVSERAILNMTFVRQGSLTRAIHSELDVRVDEKPIPHGTVCFDEGVLLLTSHGIGIGGSLR